jgi:hypothetical protein
LAAEWRSVSLPKVDQRDRTASEELQSWYREGLRPRLARAAQLGIADPKRLAALDRELLSLIGADPDVSAPDSVEQKAA